MLSHNELMLCLPWLPAPVVQIKPSTASRPHEACLYTEVNNVHFHKMLIIWNPIQISLIEPLCYLTFMPWLLFRVFPISAC